MNTEVKRYYLEINSFSELKETKLTTKDFQIFKAYPNPFNAKITFEISASKNTVGELIIFDISGKEIKSIKNVNIQSGINNMFWDGRDDNGFVAPTGIYFLSFKSDLGRHNQKIILVK